MRNRIRKGIKLLNKELGKDWIDRIDVSEISEKFSCQCIAGQLYRGHSQMQKALNLSDEDRYEYGFFIEDMNDLPSGNKRQERWAESTKMWKEEISKLKKGFQLFKGI